MVEDRTRRRTLKTLGLGALAGLAGCMNQGEQNTSPTNTTRTTARAGTGTDTTTQQEGTDTTTDGDKQKQEAAVVDDFEQLSAWKVKNGDLSAMTENAYAGSQSAVITRKNGEPVIERSLDADFEGSNLSMAVNLDAEKHAVLQITLLNENNQNSVQLAESIRHSASGFWHRLDLGTTEVSGLPNLGDVTKIRIRLKGAGSGGKIRVDDLRKVGSPDQGYVALVFDDGQASDYTKAFQTLKQYDIPATSAVVTEHVGNDGFLTMKQMEEMKSAGWEFASQTATHKNLLYASRLEAQEEVVGSKEWLVDHGFKKGAKSFMYPYGLYDSQVTNFVSKHYDMGFGLFSARNAASGNITDQMTISRGNGRHVDQAASQVDFASLYNDLEVITFHGIDREGKMDISSGEFEEFAQYLSNADVKPITLSKIPDVAQPKDGW
ncbi:polysaccharide deacetylase family protein [Haloarchaeobius amylolyticus]|uniref:polysaccharide deacetylase family protein n=1 Tax=Haloarchaeobius amylolyticus TaxID=1198296 RepID=UPI002270FE7E|nr:polysaccharide deacetylase family protein [Haloarchaeobius amylolyticus]